MKKDSLIAIASVIIYLLFFLVALVYLSYYLWLTCDLFDKSLTIFLTCVIIGGFGGVFYCLRGVYINHSVKKNWGSEWVVWYIIRPIVSLMCGGVSYLFLKAGLLILEAKRSGDSTNLGFFAFAFIAGMNVDKFISKIEELAKATWGIEKGNASTEKNN